MTDPLAVHDDPFVTRRDKPRLVIFSGAGLSAESGIATFRDSDGLWENHDVEEVCNIDTFEKNYRLVHKFYNQRRIQLGTVHPNIAHETIAHWQKKYGEDRVSVITANVDDLLERGGCTKVTHIHGKLTEMVMRRGEPSEFVQDIGYKNFDADHWLNHEVKAKPNVVFFGECTRYDNEKKKVNIYDHMLDVFRSLTVEDTVIVIGTSEVVVPVWWHLAGKPCHTVWVNPVDSKNHYMTSFLGTACTQILNVDEYLVKRRMDD